MNRNTDIFKLESNKLLPEKGKLLISEPFLKDTNFGRSVILLVDHNDQEGTMGLIMNKELPFHVNDFVEEFKYYDPIPLYKGGPVSTDTLFYLHTFGEIEGALPLTDGIYLNGDFTTIKRYILQDQIRKEKIRFFLGYSGWDPEQLKQEIEENTWFIGNTDLSTLLSTSVKDMWKTTLGTLGSKYEAWSRFPQNPSLN